MLSFKEGRAPMVRWGLIIFISGYFTIAAQAVSVFEVRRRLAMNNNEVTEKDFYLNGGAEKGLKPGMIVMVNRQVTLYDTYQNKSPGDLLVPVGELKIIFVQKGVSVARENRVYDRKNLPVLDEHYIMIGDEVDVGSARMEKSSKNAQQLSEPQDSRPEPVVQGSASSASMSPAPAISAMP